MAGGHAVRGAISAGMILILLDALGRNGGAIQSGRFGSFINDANGLVQRALSPDVPAIPDRRAGGSSSTPAFGITPQAAAAAAKVAANEPGISALLSPTGGLGGLTSLQQYANGGLSTAIANNPALHPAG